MKIGVLGGGQLARMLALAGHPLGIKLMFLDPSKDACAGPVAEHLQGEFTDKQLLTQMAEQCDLITYEFENVALESVEFLLEKTSVHPGAKALFTAQDRLNEKTMFQQQGIPTARFAAIDSLQQLQQAVTELGLPAVLKTRRLGYDGKGQAVIRKQSDVEAAWKSISAAPAILEAFVPFDREVSIIAVRSINNTTAFYPLTENVHQNGILHLSRCINDKALQAQAEKLAQTLLTELDYVGVLALELFQVGNELLANEFAPRVHNSGHWTMEGAYCSQFENHLRAVAGLPLGNTQAVCPSAMVNLVGTLPEITDVLKVPGAHLHLYDKSPRAGRKIGHINICANNDNDLGQRIDQILALIR